jgi:hypothetical protein
VILAVPPNGHNLPRRRPGDQVDHVDFPSG